MPESLLPYVQQISGVERMPTVQPAGQTAVRNLQNFAQDTSQLSEGLYQRIRTNELLHAQTKMAQGISRIEMQYQGDPGMMSQAFESFKSGLTKDIQDQEVKAQIDAQYQTSVLPAINRATAQFKQRTDEEARFNTNLRIIQLQDELSIATKEAFSPDPQISQNARIRAYGIGKQIQTLGTQKDSDGNFMYGADNASKMFAQAADDVHIELLNQMIDQSENPDLTFDRIANGGVSYTVPGNENGFAGIGGQKPEAIFESMIQQESGGVQTAISPAGAIGVAQVMPGTAPEAAKMAGLPWDENKYRTDANYNKAIGLAYFKNMQERFGDNTLAIMAYNAGPATVQDFIDGTNVSGKNPGKDKIGDPRTGEITDSEFASQFPIKETRDYVRKVKRGVGVSTVDIMGSFSPYMSQRVKSELEKRAQERRAEKVRMRQADEAAQKLNAQAAYDSIVVKMKQLPSDPSQRAIAITQLIGDLNTSQNILMQGGKDKDADALRTILLSGGATQDDSLTLTSITNMQMAGSGADDDMIRNAMLSGQLTYKTAMSLMEISKVSGSQNAEKEGNNIIKEALAPTLEKDPEKGAQVIAVQQQYIDSVNQWKAANPGQQIPKEMARKLAADALSQTDFFKGTLYHVGFPTFITMAMPEILSPNILGEKDPNVAWKLKVEKANKIADLYFKNKHNNKDEEITKDPEYKKYIKAMENAEADMKMSIFMKNTVTGVEKSMNPSQNTGKTGK